MRSKAALTSIGAILGGLVFGLVVALPVPVSAAPLIDCVSNDNGDPVMTDVTFSSSVVDVTDGPQTVTVTALADDTGGPGPAAGLRIVEVSLIHGNGDYERVKMEDAGSGEWVGTVRVPRWTKPGEWRVGQAFLVDNVGQEVLYGNEEDAVPFTNTFTVVGPRDKTNPTLKGFTFTPNRVNTMRHERKLRFTARATDDLSGVARIVVGFRSKTRGNGFAELHRKTGTANTFLGPGVIRRWIGTSDWKVWIVVLVDRAHNVAYYFNRRLEELGFKRDFRVVSGKDTDGPKVTRFTLSPEKVDLRTTSQTVTVTVRAKDTQSGIKRVEVWLGGAVTRTVDLDLVSGSVQKGVWRGTATIRQCPARTGVLLAAVDLFDARGHQVFLRTRQLAERGWPSRARVVARPDAIPPRAHIDGGGVPVSGPAVMTFDEPVNGISASSAVVYRNLSEFIPGHVIPGTWKCKTHSGKPTSCADGRVRTALFRPDAHFRKAWRYVVILNPEHSLEATDLAGNPFDRHPFGFGIVR